MAVKTVKISEDAHKDAKIAAAHTGEGLTVFIERAIQIEAGRISRPTVKDMADRKKKR